MAADLLGPGAQPLALPSRISVFGLTRLPASHLKVLKAMSAHRDVHLFLLHPSGALWDKVAAAVPHPPAGMARAEDPTATLAGHPLLRSWGRDAREMQLVLASEGVTGGEHRPVAGPRPGLLGRIQADIRADRAPAGPPAPGDRGPPPPFGRGRRQLARPFLPRAGPPGGGRPRGRAPPAGGRPDARTPRRDHDVPRHRAVRPPGERHFWVGRARWGARVEGSLG